MWERKVVKQKAKDRLRTGYWKMVLVGLILAICTIGYGGDIVNFGVNSSLELSDDDTDIYVSRYGYGVNAYGYYSDPEEYLERELRESLGTTFDWNDPVQMSRLWTIVVCVIIFFLALAFMLIIFVFNPLSMGGKKFFFENIEKKPEAKELTVAFDTNYRNVVKIMFLRHLFVFLWSLLFVIPGIIKAYEYRMIPYLLAENPNLSQEDAFAISRRMMDGNKGKAFVFDLSFVGWWLLGPITFGLVNLFYVNPYYFQADAMLYDAIKIDDQNRHGASRTQSQTFDGAPTDGMQY